jgi:hypothetical protein
MVRVKTADINETNYNDQYNILIGIVYYCKRIYKVLSDPFLDMADPEVSKEIESLAMKYDFLEAGYHTITNSLAKFDPHYEIKRVAFDDARISGEKAHW